ncbi:MAG: prepilin-type N-terminal cleavage/methylation domain-containing protein [Desulfobacteraceae bacterium]|jgi:prepilin-type N-terminal cleavage/methylation domain-containing protein
MLKENHKTVKRVKGNEGFTLLEVIMAISILTIGLLAVASLQINAMRGNSMSMDYTESTERVQDRVEKLLNLDIGDAALADSDGDGTDGLDITGDDADHKDYGSIYNIFWNVADDKVWNGAGWRDVNGVKTIRVIVTWTDRGAPRTYKFDLLRNRI